MKISPLVFLLAPAYGFVPTAKFGVKTALPMSTETESETKVREMFRLFIKEFLFQQAAHPFNIAMINKGFRKASRFRQAWCCHWKGPC